MNKLQKCLFLSIICMNGATWAGPEELKKVLNPKNVAKFNRETCYTLDNEEDIKTCAQVKIFMAQALEQSTSSGSVSTWALTGLSGILAGVASMFCEDADLRLCICAALIGGFGGCKLGRYWDNSSSQKGAREFMVYFNRLVENPTVVDRSYALKNQDEINKNFNSEKQFNAVCEGLKLLETSPLFAQYRLTREVPVSNVLPVGSTDYENN